MFTAICGTRLLGRVPHRSAENVPLSERVTNPAKGRYADACFEGFPVPGALKWRVKGTAGRTFIRRIAETSVINHTDSPARHRIAARSSPLARRAGGGF